MMISGLNLVAASSPTVHIAPTRVLTIGGINITNSMIYGWATIIIMILLLTSVARRISIKPQGGFVNFVETIVDFVINTVESSFLDRNRAKKYVPYFVTLFCFILVNNWFGLIPIVGEGFKAGGNPLLRPFTADLNGTLAMGLITMGYVYVSSIRELGGFKKYFRHFFIGNPLNPLYFFIGMLEIISDLTRVLSLSLRLFLNVAIGEIIIAVFSFLGHTYLSWLLALPFTLLEVLVGALQAYIFTLLAVMYLAIAVNEATEHERQHDDSDLTPATTPGTIELAGKV